MRDDRGTIREEIARFPKTGRFLASRFRHAMTEEEKQLLESLVVEVRETTSRTKILSRGDSCEYSIILIEGFITRVIGGNTDRSIVGFQVPGDFVDLHGFALKRLDHDLCTLGYTKFGLVPHDRLQSILENEPRLTSLFWFETLLDASIHREWLSKMARLRAVGRIAHIITEIWYRLRMVGLGNSSGFNTPLTQVDLANICGLSEIHVNRSIRDLRESKVVDFRRGRITILDAGRLKDMARFNPAYLYGEEKPEIGPAWDKAAGERQLAQ